MIHTYYGKYIYPYLAILIFFLLINNINCKEKSATEPGSGNTAKKDSSIIIDFKFILFDSLNNNIIPSIQQKLNENYPRVLNDLEVNNAFPVTIKIWNNEKNFLDIMEQDIGQRFQGAGGYITYNEIRVLNRNNVPLNVLHEFCHIVSIYVNNTIANNPRWLWEAAAIYESGDFTDPKTLPYMVSGDYPPMSELNSGFKLNGNKIYKLGYVLDEYIITKWGKSGLISLIKNNGDTNRTFGIPLPELQSGWYLFIKDKYLSDI
jgi:hypothetical protein